MDHESFNIISNLDNKKIVLFKFSDFENENLRKLKKERRKNEYFWTITPKLPLIIFDNFKEVINLKFLKIRQPKPLFTKIE